MEDEKKVEAEITDDMIVGLINTEEFIEYEKEINQMDSYIIKDGADTKEIFDIYMKDVLAIPLLTKERELELTTIIYENKDILPHNDLYKEAEDILVTSNLRLVISIAKRFLNRGLDIEDLIQDGNMGLIKSIDRFDPNRGVKFATYATWWIRHYISRSIAMNARTIRIPVSVLAELNKVKYCIRDFMCGNGRYPTIEEISEITGFDENRVMFLQCISDVPLSLDSTVGGSNDDEDLNYYSVVKDPNTPDTLSNTIKAKNIEKVLELMEKLDDRAQEILKLRFGFIDGNTHTLQEIAERYGITRERIRQIEASAIWKLKNMLKSEGYR